MDDKVVQSPSLVLSTAKRLLKPIARLLLAHGVTFPAIAEIIKQVLVEVAEQDFPIKGKVTTDSRISVISGVHRKDVKRLREQGPPQQVEPKSVSLGSQIVNTWISGRKWQDQDKKPLDLPRVAARKGLKSFESLVESVSKDVRPRAVLDELLRLGVVEMLDDVVHLNVAAFIPRDGLEEKLFYLERGNYSHLAAAVSNLQGEQAPFFDRMVHYDSIPADAMQELVEQVDRMGMQCLSDVNSVARQASDHQAADLQRLTLGVYVYHEAVSQADKQDK
ncbi:MAG: DUF6502 family protein [Chromatiales bacterium]|jgi:hypothetical protein